MVNSDKMPGLQYKKPAADRRVFKLGLSINEQTALVNALSAYNPYDAKERKYTLDILHRAKFLKSLTVVG